MLFIVFPRSRCRAESTRSANFANFKQLTKMTESLICQMSKLCMVSFLVALLLLVLSSSAFVDCAPPSFSIFKLNHYFCLMPRSTCQKNESSSELG